MDPSELPLGRPSPRRENQIQGPRPTPLKVSKDSHKINKKPPIAPAAAFPPPRPQTQHRPPVIIYAVSPKVIHTDASEFMALVQRLTGNSSSSSAAAAATAPSSSSYADVGSGALSPAARLASIEKTKSAADGGRKSRTGSVDFMDQLDIETLLDRAGPFSGILSPVPASLPPISPNLFSPPSEPNSLSFLHDLSPIFQGNRSFMDSPFINSPNPFLSATITSPTPSFDFLNHFFDL
ncbi:hypothetical protein ACLOJK_006076 [Asimina triloba]